MAILRFEVTKVIKEFNGNTCEVESKLISAHSAVFTGTFEQISKRPLIVGEEFQENNNISRKDIKTEDFK